MFALDEACKPLAEAFGEKPYLVGTAATGKQSYRDVDVRLILPDEKYDAIFNDFGHPLIAFLGFSIGDYLAGRTGLPIDFQIQRRTEANELHSGRRNALATRSLVDFTGDCPVRSNHND